MIISFFLNLYFIGAFIFRLVMEKTKIIGEKDFDDIRLEMSSANAVITRCFYMIPFLIFNAFYLTQNLHWHKLVIYFINFSLILVLLI